MNISQSASSPNFQAKFLYSESLENVAKFAVKHNAFGKLNRMQKHISRLHLKTRLKLDVSVTEQGFPQAIFTRYYPKYHVRVPRTMEDYYVSKKITYTSETKEHPFWFAMQKIIEMGKFAAHNERFIEVVVSK